MEQLQNINENEVTQSPIFSFSFVSALLFSFVEIEDQNKQDT